MTYRRQNANSPTVANPRLSRYRRALASTAILVLVLAAIGVPVVSPEPAGGTSPVLAIAWADCPPECGGPGGGGTPSGPPGGGTEFAPPSIPATPSYDPGRGQPPSDQNNGISIYNSASPQPGRATQPSQAPVQNQDGTYSRAANGEQQPINYQQAPTNQGISTDWQELADQLNRQQSPQGQDNAPEQTQNEQQNRDDKCESIRVMLQLIEAEKDSIVPTPEQIDNARQALDDMQDHRQKVLQQQGGINKRIKSGADAGTAVVAAPPGDGTTNLQTESLSPYEYARQLILNDRLGEALRKAGIGDGECQTPASGDADDDNPLNSESFHDNIDRHHYGNGYWVKVHPASCSFQYIVGVKIESPNLPNPTLKDTDGFNHESISLYRNTAWDNFVVNTAATSPFSWGDKVAQTLWSELECWAQSDLQLKTWLTDYRNTLFDQLRCHMSLAPNPDDHWRPVALKEPIDIEPGRVDVDPATSVVKWHCNPPFASGL